MPLGIAKSLIKYANTSARDIENKQRFKNAIIDEDCTFSLDSTVGNNSHILKGAIINHSKIGSFTYLGCNTLVQNATIGNYCSISHDVILGLGTHPLGFFSTSPIFYKVNNTFKIQLTEEDIFIDEYKPIIIGSDVWIGARAIVLDGVTVGHGAVLAAGTIVTKDVPPYAIMGGVPGKLIRYRFSENVRNELLGTKWWENDAKDVYKERYNLNEICLKENENV